MSRNLLASRSSAAHYRTYMKAERRQVTAVLPMWWATVRARHSTWQACTALSFMRLFTSCALKMSARSASPT
jgi:hypothetical protein